MVSEQVDAEGRVTLDVNMGRATLDKLLLKEGLVPEMLVDASLDN